MLIVSIKSKKTKNLNTNFENPPELIEILLLIKIKSVFIIKYLLKFLLIKKANCCLAYLYLEKVYRSLFLIFVFI